MIGHPILECQLDLNKSMLFCANLSWVGLAHDSEATSFIREVCLWGKEIKGGLSDVYFLPLDTILLKNVRPELD